MIVIHIWVVNLQDLAKKFHKFIHISDMRMVFRHQNVKMAEYWKTESEVILWSGKLGMLQWNTIIWRRNTNCDNFFCFTLFLQRRRPIYLLGKAWLNRRNQTRPLMDANRSNQPSCIIRFWEPTVELAEKQSMKEGKH